MNQVKNSVRLIGRLGTDPDLRDAGRFKKVSFNMATNEIHLDNEGNRKEETQWHHVVCWGKNAEILARCLKKGSELAIEGKLQTRSYDDKEGRKQYITEVVIRDFTFVGKKPD